MLGLVGELGVVEPEDIAFGLRLRSLWGLQGGQAPRRRKELSEGPGPPVKPRGQYSRY